MLRPALAMVLLLSCHLSAEAAEPLYAVAVTYAPVLNRPDFYAVFGGSDRKTLAKDSCSQLRALEFVALPGTVFTVEAEVKSGSQHVFKVATAEYPYRTTNGYFIESRSVRLEKNKPPERVRTLPEKGTILAALKQRIGTPYVWGGNRSAGVSELRSWYPPAQGAKLSNADNNLWIVAGVDCSGLLYEATGGYTPRNTSSLITFGKTVPIAGKSSEEIAAALQPLDLLVWPGHLLIALDDGRIIESRLDCGNPAEGVRARPAAKVLADIVRKRRPADSIRNNAQEFVVRRWYGVQ